MDLQQFNLVAWKSKTIYAGQKYGRLTILATGKIPNTFRYKVICQCDCGSKPFATRVDQARKSKNANCGCVRKEKTTIHGCWGHPLFRVWKAMMDRCYNPKDKRFKHYNGRSITVCQKWHSPKAFISDMFPSYKPGLQIERLNNNKGYCFENCSWVTYTQQQRNKTNNVLLTYNGETKCIGEWAEITGLTYGTLWDRIKVQGWPTERALTTPPLSANERLYIARKAKHFK